MLQHARRNAIGHQGQAQRLPRHRHSGRQGKVRLAGQRGAFRRRHRLQERRRRRSTFGAVPQRDRRVLRQCRRRHPQRGPRSDQRPCPDRAVRLDLKIRCRRNAARPGELLQFGGQARAHGGLHRPKLSRTCFRGLRGTGSLAARRQPRAQGGHRVWPGECAEGIAASVCRRKLREAAGEGCRCGGVAMACRFLPNPPRLPYSTSRKPEIVVSRTIKFAKAGGPDVLEFIEAQVPFPGPGEVRINVKAIGVNRAESMWRNDKYVEPVKFPAGLGYEAAGVVDAVGKDVTDFATGDTVSTIPAFSLNQYFTYGEVILAPVHAVVKHPEALSFVEAASIWMMFLTAYGALIL